MAPWHAPSLHLAKSAVSGHAQYSRRVFGVFHAPVVVVTADGEGPGRARSGHVIEAGGLSGNADLDRPSAGKHLHAMLRFAAGRNCLRPGDFTLGEAFRGCECPSGSR